MPGPDDIPASDGVRTPQERTEPGEAPFRPDRSLFRRIKDRFWGYDFFISYHWASGGLYAVNLAQRLRDRHYDVFLDRAEFASGDNWEKVGKVALFNTKRLVLISTREAVESSRPVEIEVTHFTRLNRQVISIVFGDRFADLDRSRYPTLRCMSASQLFIEDTRESLTSSPSQTTIDELIRTHRVMRRRDIRAILTLIAMLVVGAFAAVAGTFWIRAELSAQEARKQTGIAEGAQRGMEGALVGSYFRTIGVPGAQSHEQREALWDLSELQNDSVRKRVLTSWFDTADYAKRPFRAQGAGLRAVTGLRGDLQQLASEKCAVLANRVVASVDAAESTSDLVDLIDQMDPRVASPPAASALETWTGRLMNQENPNWGGNAASMLHLADRLDAVAAKQLTRSLIDGLAKRQEHERSYFQMVEELLQTSSTRMKPDDAASFGEEWVKAMEGSRREDLRAHGVMGIALATVASRAQRDRGAGMASRGAAALVAGLVDPNVGDWLAFDLVAKAIDGLSAHLNASDAVRIAEPLSRELERSTPPEDRGSWRRRRIPQGLALAALARRMEAEPAARIAAQGGRSLTECLADFNAYSSLDLEKLGSALARLASRMESKDAANVVVECVEICAKASNDSERLPALGKTFAALPYPRESQEAAGAVVRGTEFLTTTLEAWSESRGIVIDQVTELGETLDLSIARLDESGRARVAGRAALAMAKRLRNSSGSFPQKVQSLLVVFMKPASRMDPKGAALVTEALVPALANEQSGDFCWYLGKALESAAERMNSSGAAAAAESLAKAAENPDLHDPARRTAIGFALGALISRINLEDASALAGRSARVLAEALESLPKSSQSSANVEILTDDELLTKVRVAFERFAGKMGRPEATKIADRLANDLEQSDPHDARRMAVLGVSIAALTAASNKTDAEAVNIRAARVLAKALEPGRFAPDEMSKLGLALASNLEFFEAARETRRFAIANIMLVTAGDRSDEVRRLVHERQLARWCAPLDLRELSGVLKWPVCGGEAQQVVLSELERKSGKKFGNVWTFAEQAKALGIDDVEQPAKRPRSESSIRELEALMRPDRTP